MHNKLDMVGINFFMTYLVKNLHVCL